MNLPEILMCAELIVLRGGIRIFTMIFANLWHALLILGAMGCLVYVSQVGCKVWL